MNFPSLAQSSLLRRLAPLLLWLLLPFPAAADTWYVCPSGCDSPSILGALSMASDGDTIQLLSLLPHTESGILVFRSLEIRGVQGQGMVVQAAASEGIAGVGVFTVPEGVEVQIRDLEIRHGDAVDSGGAIHNEGHLTLERVTVRDSESGYRGGGIYNGGSLFLVASDVIATEANQGGGIYNSADGTMVATDCELSSLTAQDHSLGGGALLNAGTAELSRCVISDSKMLQPADAFPPPVRGGGIYNQGDLSLHDVLFLGNSAEGAGGALYQSSGETTMEGVTFFANGIPASVTGPGGAIHVFSGSLNMVDSLFQSNVSTGKGGALYSGRDATIVIAHTTFFGNNADDEGGAIYTDSASAPRLHNVTLTNNEAAYGGAIYVRGRHSIRLSSSTVTENDAVEGGGIYLGTECDSGICSLASRAFMKNSIVANNLDDQSASALSDDCVGEIRSDGYNLVEDGSTGELGSCKVTTDLTGVITGVDPSLLSVGDNGGPTLYPDVGFYLATHALSSSSQAVDAGDPAGCTDYFGTPAPVDERYASRVGICDLGAFEYGGVPKPPGELFSDGFESGDATAWSSATP